MAVPSLTVRSAQPRLFFRDTDLAMYQARAADADGWKTAWDATIRPGANARRLDTDFSWVSYETIHTRLLPVVLVGWMEETSRVDGGFRDMAIRAADHLCDIPDTSVPTNDRYRSLALALVFDAFRHQMTTTEYNKILAEMIVQMNRGTMREDEKVDGHSANDSKCRLACVLAGYGHGTRNWNADLQAILTWWYGTSVGRMETCRYFHSDGAPLAGGNYSYLRLWSESWLPWILTKSTDYDALAAESAWMEKLWEFLLWNCYSGGASFDYESHGDTARISEPIFILELRWAQALLMGAFPSPGGTDGDRHLRWMYDQYLTRETQTAESLGFDFLFFDRASVSALAPASASPAISTRRFFSPPNLFYARDSWDYTGPMYRISGRERYELGHRHQDAGSIAITYSGEPLLLTPAGRYDVFDSVPHHGNWYQRTMGQSGALLVYDPAQVYTFYNKARENDGGQQLKKYLHPIHGEIADAWNVEELRNDGGGLAWKRSDFSVQASSGDHRFLVCDAREAHKRRHTDTPRFSVYKSSYLLIAPTPGNGLPCSALLVYHRVVKTTNSWRTCVPWHFRGTVTAQTFGCDGTGGASVGRLWIDLRNPSAYTTRIDVQGSPLVNGYGPTQFLHYWTGVNMPPSVAVGTRHDPWTKRSTWWVEQTTRAADERYVFLLMPAAYAASEPVSSRAWSTDEADPDWYKITLGTVTYGIHRTLDQATFGDVEIDTTPPAEVTDQALAARDRALLYTFTDPADGDLAGVEVQFRTSEIT